MNILIENNRFFLKNFVLNVKLGHAIIGSYEVKIIIKAK